MNLTDADRAAWATYEAANKRAADEYNPNCGTAWWTKQTCPHCGTKHVGDRATCHRCQREKR